MLQRWGPDPDHDLSYIVTRLRSVRKSTRVRLANDPLTRRILDAAVTLIDQQFMTSEVSVDDDERRYPFFQWLSRNKVAAELLATEMVTQTPDMTEVDRDERIKSLVKQIERRWFPHERFIQDLLDYALSRRYWSLHVSLSGDALQGLLERIRSGSFVQGVHEVAYADLRIPIETPSLQRIQLLAALLAERDLEIRQVLQELYTVLDKSWITLYEGVMAERGWRLRPDVSLQDLNLMLSTAAEGMALRALVDPAGLIDPEAETSLLGKLVLAVLASCIDTGDGMGLEDLVSRMTTSQPD